MNTLVNPTLSYSTSEKSQKGHTFSHDRKALSIHLTLQNKSCIITNYRLPLVSSYHFRWMALYFFSRWAWNTLNWFNFTVRYSVHVWISHILDRDSNCQSQELNCSKTLEVKQSNLIQFDSYLLALQNNPISGNWYIPQYSQYMS